MAGRIPYKEGEARLNYQEGFCQLCGAWRGCLGLEPTPELYIKHLVDIFREARRVLRNDGVLWLNLGDGYCGTGGEYKNGSRGINSCVGKTSPENCPGSGRRDKIKNMVRSGLKPKDLVGIPWRIALALQADGWYLRSDIIWNKPNPMPESVTDRPTKSHEYLFLLTKSAKYFYDNEAIKEKSCDPAGTHRGGALVRAARGGGQDLTGKVSWEHHGGGIESLLSTGKRNKRSVWTIATRPFPEAHFATFPEKLIEPCILAGTSEKGCCVECGAPWERVVEKIGANISNEDGIKKMINKGVPRQKANLYITQERGTSKTIGWQPGCKCGAETKPCIVLDPFGGAMTTAVVAHKHGRQFIMIELSKKYIDDIGIPRIERETKQLKLF